MFDAIIGLIQLCLSSVWGLVGAVVGLISAAAVWHLVDQPLRGAWAALTYVVVFCICLVVGQFMQEKE